MTDAITVALVAGGCSVVVGILSFIGQLIISNRTQAISMKEIDAKVEQLSAVTNVKLDELTREVREHNNFAKRVPLLEVQVDYMGKQIEVLQKNGEK